MALRAASTSIAGWACAVISRGLRSGDGAASAGQKRDQIRLADLAVADRRVGLRCMIVREDDGAARMGAQTVQHRREVGVARQDDELVEVRVVGEDVADIHHDADIGGILELRGERRAVDDFEARAQEVMPDERERVHVGRIVVRIPARHGIAVAAVHRDAALVAGTHTSSSA